MLFLLFAGLLAASALARHTTPTSGDLNEIATAERLIVAFLPDSVVKTFNELSPDAKLCAFGSSQAAKAKCDTEDGNKAKWTEELAYLVSQLPPALIDLRHNTHFDGPGSNSVIVDVARVLRGLSEEEKKQLVELLPKTRAFVRGANAEKLQDLILEIGYPPKFPGDFDIRGIEIIYNVYKSYVDENLSDLKQLGFGKKSLFFGHHE